VVTVFWWVDIKGLMSGSAVRTRQSKSEVSESRRFGLRKQLLLFSIGLVVSHFYAGMSLDRVDTTEAIRQLSEAVAREPRNALAYSHMAHAYRMSGDYEQCVSAAQKSIELDPREPVAHLWLGDCLRPGGQITLAKAAYDHALKLSDYDPGFRGGSHIM
jgi:Flp pilus assembly protein TadD